MRLRLRTCAFGLAIALGAAGRSLGQGPTLAELSPDPADTSIALAAVVDRPDLDRALGVASRAVTQSILGYGCDSCPPAVPAPYWHHPLFPLFRPRPVSPFAPNLPAPSTPPAETEPPKTTTPSLPGTTPPGTTPPGLDTASGAGEAPAAGTETGGRVGEYDNMFGAPFGGGGSVAIIGPRAMPGALSGPGTITFPSTHVPSLPFRFGAFALVPVTVAANGVSGTVSSISQLPPITNPNAPPAYTTPAFGVPANQSQTNTYVSALTQKNITSAIQSVPSNPHSYGQAVVGQPSSVFYAAQAAEQSVHPNAQLQSLHVTNPTAVLTPTKAVVFSGNFASTILLPFAGVTGQAITIPDPASGGVVGRQKPSEDANPLPRDRIIFNYDYFSNVQLGNSVDVNRFQVGFEKTFFNGLTSVEVRLPFAATLASDLNLGNQITRTEIGDLRITPRLLLWNERTVHVGAGMSIYLPTADGTNVVASDGTALIRIPNRSVVLSPYIGVLFTPNRRLFAQTWVACDFDTNGDPVQVNADGMGLAYAGRLRDPANLGLDGQVGYWIYREPKNRGVTGLGPFVELHYGGNVQARGLVSDSGFIIPSGGINQLNLTSGVSMLMGMRSMLQLGVVVPLRQDDKNFNLQIGVHGNFFFGPRVGTPPLYVSSF